eukprot:Hpha_TRINITY_DN7776_c0_g1::TRINITY_DN7776_c0_g1_i2::g.85506::m.85506
MTQPADLPGSLIKVQLKSRQVTGIPDNSVCHKYILRLAGVRGGKHTKTIPSAIYYLDGRVKTVIRTEAQFQAYLIRQKSRPDGTQPTPMHAEYNAFLGESSERTTRTALAREQGAQAFDEARPANSLSAQNQTSSLARSLAKNFDIPVEREVTRNRKRNRSLAELQHDLRSFRVEHLQITGPCGEIVGCVNSKPTSGDTFIRHVIGCDVCERQAEELLPGCVDEFAKKWKARRYVVVTGKERNKAAEAARAQRTMDDFIGRRTEDGLE